MLLLSFTTLAFLLLETQSFQVPSRTTPIKRNHRLFSSTTTGSILDRIEGAKEDLVQLCNSSTKPSLDDVRAKVQSLEELAEQGGIGQASCHSGLLSGEW